MKYKNVLIYATPHEVAREAAEKIVKASAEAIHNRGIFTIALSGGSTPKLLYQMLASKQMENRVDWSKWQVFVGDERFVPLNHSDSNFGMAVQTFLSQVPIPPENLHPVKTGVSNIKLAVEHYVVELQRVFDGFPTFDIVLTGLGAKDCHILSLFPNSNSLRERDRWVVWTPPGVMPPPVDRITLTLPVVNSAREVLFLVTGEEKAEAVERVFTSDPSQALPASLVEPANGDVVWLVDQAAAKFL